MFPGHVMRRRQDLCQWRPTQDQTATVGVDDGERQIGTPTGDQLELVRRTGTRDVVVEPRTDARGVDASPGRPIPTTLAQLTAEILTTSPVAGAWIIEPPPM